MIAFVLIALGLLTACALLLRARSRDRRAAALQRIRHAREVDQLVHQQDLRIMDAMKRGEDRERDRADTDLKERLNTMFSTIRVGFGHLEEQIDAMDQRHEEQSEKVLTRLDDALTDMRRAGKATVRIMLERFGLDSVLEDMRWALEAAGSVRVALVVQGLDPRLERNVQVGLYHLVNDAVDHALGHEGVDRLDIRIIRSGDQCTLSIEDNGGVRLREHRASVEGQRRLEARIVGLRGSVVASDLPQGGHSLRMEIPLGG